MVRPMRSVLLTLMFAGGTLAFQAGCSQPQAPVEQSRLSKLAIFYGKYIGQNKGQSPGTEKELKDFIQKNDNSVNLDELFVSPRDKEPYVVRYKIGMAAPGAVAVTAHEKTGVGGNKMVSLATGEVRTVDEAELQKLLGAK